MFYISVKHYKVCFKIEDSSKPDDELWPKLTKYSLDISKVGDV